MAGPDALGGRALPRGYGNQRIPHQSQQTQPVGRAELESEQHDEQADRGGMTNELVWFFFYHLLISNNHHTESEIATKSGDGIESATGMGIENTSPASPGSSLL